MGVIETKTFKANGQVAVYLPADTALPEGTTVRVERIGDGVRITPLAQRDPEEERRRVLEMTARLREIWKDAPRPPAEAREPIEFPDRPGL